MENQALYDALVAKLGEEAGKAAYDKIMAAKAKA